MEFFGDFFQSDSGTFENDAFFIRTRVNNIISTSSSVQNWFYTGNCNILISKHPSGMVKHAAQASGKEAFLTSAGEWAMFLTSAESQSLCSSLTLAYSVVVAKEKCNIMLHLG